MKIFPLALGLILVLAFPGLATEPTKTLGFPFDLTGRMEKEVCTKTLTDLHLNRDSFDQDFSAWALPHKFHYKSFKPNGMTLRYRNERLFQVNMIQEEILECADVANVVPDAVDFIVSQYVIHPENVQKAPHFESNNCVYYMKPGNIGWGAVEGDYAVNVDSHWRDMKYSVYVTYTYLPLYSSTSSSSSSSASVPSK